MDLLLLYNNTLGHCHRVVMVDIAETFTANLEICFYFHPLELRNLEAVEQYLLGTTQSAMVVSESQFNPADAKTWQFSVDISRLTSLVLQ